MQRKRKGLVCWGHVRFLKCLFLIVSLLAIQSQPALAKPSATVRFLMNDSVSMLDWGLFGIEHYFSPESFTLEPRPRVAARYDWRSNKILISAAPLTENRFANKEKAEEWCRSVILEIKTRLGLGEKTGKPEEGDSSTLYSFFTHKGYETEGLPEDLGSKMDYLTEISVSAAAKGPQEEKITISCQAALLGIGVSFSEKTDR